MTTDVFAIRNSVYIETYGSVVILRLTRYSSPTRSCSCFRIVLTAWKILALFLGCLVSSRALHIIHDVDLTPGLGHVQDEKAHTVAITSRFSQVTVLSVSVEDDDMLLLTLYCQPIAQRDSTGGGLWHPDAEPLARLRSNIDRKPSKIKRVLTLPGIRKDFFDGISDNEKKAVKAFLKNNQEDMLKRKPKVSFRDYRNVQLCNNHCLSVSKQTTKPNSS